MLTLLNTPNLVGLEISGDFADLDTLYRALSTVVGDEWEYKEDVGGARLRVLGVCYDLRHTLMGDNEIQWVDNGMDREKMKLMGLVAPEKNVYYMCRILYPEILFVAMALNDFIRLYAKKQTRTARVPMLDVKNQWDASISAVRLFQALVFRCVNETVTEAAFKRMLALLRKHTGFEGYATQYVDLLNLSYLDALDADERRRMLFGVVRRMLDNGNEYQAVAQRVRQAAVTHHCLEEDIELELPYPEEILW